MPHVIMAASFANYLYATPYTYNLQANAETCHLEMSFSSVLPPSGEYSTVSRCGKYMLISIANNAVVLVDKPLHSGLHYINCCGYSSIKRLIKPFYKHIIIQSLV